MVRDLKYQIVQNKPEIIWINSKLLEDRIDYDFYSINQIRVVEKLTKVSYRKLDDLVKAKRSEPQTDSKDFSYDGIDVIRMSDIDDFIIDFSNTVKIPIDIYENLKEFTLKPNTVIFGLTGVTLGKAVPISKNIKKCITNRRIAQLEIKDAFDSFYIATFINTQYGRSQLFRYSTGVAQPNIRLEDTGEILVPIPDYDIQKYIGDKVRKAEELREEAKRLKKEAEEILNKELNLKDVEFYIKQTNNKKYSWTESIEIEDRIDSEFYKPKYRYLSKLNNMSELSYYYKISKKRINKNIDRKIKYIDLSSVNNIIEPSDFNTKELPSRAQFLVKEGNLIISTLKGSNKISIIPEHLNDSVCSTGFIVIASKSHLTTEYLYLVFSNKVFNMQIERYSTGSIMSGVNHDNFNKMLIPVISNKQIIDTITNKIRKHFRLLYYSKQLIQEAKQDVEDLIEGNFDMSKVKANN